MGVGGQGQAPAVGLPEKKPGTQFTGGCVGPRAALDRCGKLRPHRDSIPAPPRPYQVAMPMLGSVVW